MPRGLLNTTSPINRNHPLFRGLENWWLALDHLANGATWRELIRRNDGTLVNTPTWVNAGVDGRRFALNFNGTNANVTIGTVCSTPTTYTISFWAKRTAVSGGIGFDTVLSLAPPYGASVWVYPAGDVSCGDAGSSWATKAAIWTDTTYWHMITCVVETSGTVRFYVDGLDKGTATGTTTGTWGAGRFGEFATLINNSNQFSGSLDDIKIYSRALSMDEVARLYQDSKAGHPGLLNWAPIRFAPPTNLPRNASATYTQDDDTESAAATIALAATSSATQADDTISGAATTALAAGSTVVQDDDTDSAAGTISLAATTSVTQDDDTSSGAATAAIAGTSTTIQDDDTVTSTATQGLAGTASITQADDTEAATSTTEILGTASVTQSDDSLSGASTVETAATAATTQSDDALSATATSELAALATITADADTASAAATIPITATYNVTLAGDTVHASATLAGGSGSVVIKNPVFHSRVFGKSLIRSRT